MYGVSHASDVLSILTESGRPNPVFAKHFAQHFEVIGSFWSAVAADVIGFPAVALPLLAVLLVTQPWFLFCLHYTHRVMVFPFAIQSRNPVPLHIASLASLYCCFNGLLQSCASLVIVDGCIRALALTDTMPDSQFPRITSLLAILYQKAQLTSSVALILGGAILFYFGMAVNVMSDYHLIKLRKITKHEYAIPKGMFFKYLSAPNYVGEMVEWLGYGLCMAGYTLALGHVLHEEAVFGSLRLVGVSFFVYTVAKPVPTSHRPPSMV